MTRITQRAVTLTALQGLNQNLGFVGKLQQKLTSGRNFSLPSEDPTGTNKSMQIRSDARAAEQFARNVVDGQAWLTQADTTLQTMVSMTHTVRDRAVQAQNDGAMSPSARQGLAAELKTLRDGLLGLANTQVGGRPVFGGVTGGKAAYDATGAWVGNGATPVERRVSATETVRIDITGPEAFGTPGASDLFAVVDRLAASVLTANNALVDSDVADLDVVMEQMLNALASLGSRQARIDQAGETIADRALALEGTRSDIEDIDLPKTIMQLEMAKTGYEASLQATAKAIQPSLLDFLR